MLDESDKLHLDQEIKFNLEQLGTRIPKELDRLIGVFGSASGLGLPEKWYADLFLKLTNGVILFSSDLLRTIGQDALPAAAWNARNLLELCIWTKYCAKSRASAWRFHGRCAARLAGTN